MEIRDTLGNLPRTHKLYGGCGYCRRSFEVDKAVLVERFGPDYPTLDALRRVVCRECGRPATITCGHSDGEGKRP